MIGGTPRTGVSVSNVSQYICIYVITASMLNLMHSASMINRITTLRTLDISKNKIQNLGRLSLLKDLKSFNCDENVLTINSLKPISNLSKLQTLSVGKNQLDNQLPVVTAFPSLPSKIRQLKLNGNSLTAIPKQICEAISLEKLDLSFNNIAAIPPEICKLGKKGKMNNFIVGLCSSRCVNMRTTRHNVSSLTTCRVCLYTNIKQSL